MRNKKHEILVGIFLLIAFLAMIFICLKVAKINSIFTESTYRVYANFDNIVGLKLQSPVRIGGVLIGRVANISLDERTYLPRVAIDINKRYNHIPDTSSLSIQTSGLLGEKYLSLNVGFEDQQLGTSILEDGDTIWNTKSALLLEDIISQFIFNDRNNEDQKNSASSA